MGHVIHLDFLRPKIEYFVICFRILVPLLNAKLNAKLKMLGPKRAKKYLFIFLYLYNLLNFRICEKVLSIFSVKEPIEK